METERIAKMLGLMALLGGVARIGMTPAALIWGVDSFQELIAGLTACLLMGIGIFGVHLHQAERTGALGLLSVVLISFSSTLTAALVWSAMLGVTNESHDYVGTMQTVNSLSALFGMILFAVMTVRARIYPVTAVVLYMLFPVLSFIPAVSAYATVCWGLGYVLFGYYALTGKSVNRSRQLHEAA